MQAVILLLQAGRFGDILVSAINWIGTGEIAVCDSWSTYHSFAIGVGIEHLICLDLGVGQQVG